MHLLKIINELKTQEDCITYLEKKRWPDGKPTCVYCKSDKTCRHLHRWQCQACSKSFSVTVGTIFHHTHLPLQKWLMAIALVADAKKGISSRQLSRNLNLPVKTGYSLIMRIRNTVGNKGERFRTTVPPVLRTFLNMFLALFDNINIYRYAVLPNPTC